MTLRGILGGDVQRFHEQIDDLLGSADGLIVLFNGSRMVSYFQGFGVSPCQLDLLTVEIDRVVRDVIGGQPRTNRRKGGIVRKATKAVIGALPVLFVSIWVVLAAGMTAVWLTAKVRVFGLAILPTAIVASLLVVYFDWRAKLLRRVLRNVTRTGRPR